MLMDFENVPHIRAIRKTIESHVRANFGGDLCKMVLYAALELKNPKMVEILLCGVSVLDTELVSDVANLRRQCRIT